MKRTLSTGAQLTALIVAVVFIGYLVAGVIALRVSTGEQLRQIDTALSETITGAADLLETLTPNQQLALRELPSSITLGQLDPSGKPIRSSLVGPEATENTVDLSTMTARKLLAATGKPFSTTSKAGKSIRALTLRNKTGFFLATAPLGTVRASQDRLATQLTIVGLGIGAAIGLMIWGSIGTILAPLRTMITNARRIGAGERNITLDLKHGASEVRELGTSLDEMRRSLDDSTQRLQRFAADASHDLRTPIAIIRGHTQLALKGTPSVDVWRDIDRESKRMQQLIEDLWLLARLDQVDERPNGLVDLTDIAVAAAAGARLIDDTRTYQWNPPTTPALVTGDERQLRRAIDNLLTNVRSHTPTNIAVVVTITTDSGHVRCSVTDSGPGMSDNDRAQATERFWQADRSRRTPGAGLGLAIVQTIVKAHHGSIELTPSESGGLCATITLPKANLTKSNPTSTED
jgi:two-component system, OmpR family, sensor kinase